MDKGSLMLDMPDTKVRLDDAGVPLSLELETGDDAHSLIEECMLEANKAVAELELPSKRRPGRITVCVEEPEADVMHNLMEVLDSFGVKVGRELRRADLTEIINDVRGKPFERIVNLRHPAHDEDRYLFPRMRAALRTGLREVPALHVAYSQISGLVRASAVGYPLFQGCCRRG
ncbi:MAG: RNB domain-containing ribonuclease [Planctomycetota bacterium]|nr:RNB domain-containing ribonuclease [Planctomycetota bacterium]